MNTDFSGTTKLPGWVVPFEQQTVFVLSEMQGYSHEEIGRIEGVKPGTVKSRLSRAKEKLRSVLPWTAEQT